MIGFIALIAILGIIGAYQAGRVSVRLDRDLPRLWDPRCPHCDESLEEFELVPRNWEN